MPFIRVDLEDGETPVCFDLKTEDAERFADFMKECTGALADAARYRWLVSNGKTAAEGLVLREPHLWSRAIDVAMKRDVPPNTYCTPK